jgi:hypothetical protein
MPLFAFFVWWQWGNEIVVEGRKEENLTHADYLYFAIEGVSTVRPPNNPLTTSQDTVKPSPPRTIISMLGRHWPLSMVSNRSGFFHLSKSRPASPAPCAVDRLLERRGEAEKLCQHHPSPFCPFLPSPSLSLSR